MVTDNTSNEEEDDEEDHDYQSEYRWCMHCERTYIRGNKRMVDGIAMCPYQDCGGDTFSDSWDWDHFREPLPQYPAIPEHGVKYPMYPPK